MIELLKDDHFERIRGLFENADKSIQIVSPFLTASMAEWLCAAQERGLDCSFVTRLYIHDLLNRANSVDGLERMMDAGVGVYLVKGLHTKLYLFDGNKAIVGSANFTFSGLHRNLELSLLLSEEEETVTELNEYFCSLLAHIKECEEGKATPLVLAECREIINRINVSSHSVSSTDLNVTKYGADLGLGHSYSEELPEGYEDTYDKVFDLIRGSEETGQASQEPEIDPSNENTPLIEPDSEEQALLEAESESSKDFSRKDYEAVYSEILSLSDELAYIVELAKQQVPPQKGEKPKLLAAAEAGDENARERLVLMHLRLVLGLALREVKKHKFNIVDAVSNGIVALVEVVNDVNSDNASEFLRSASWRIITAIYRECSSEWMLFYYPADAKKTALPVQEAFERRFDCSNELYRPYPNRLSNEYIDSISKELGLPSKQVKIDLQRVLGQTESLSFESLSDENSEDLSELPIDLIEPDSALFDAVLDLCERAALNRAINELKPQKYGKVIRLLYGLGGREELTLEKVGEILGGVTRERIRQIEKKAKERLRDSEELVELSITVQGRNGARKAQN